ncbi:hypothetical protein [Tenacibaculum amylolyticum]|uniref:hypothetical protein n=1 Tax=Tenacibaculum amylolyticum TaxID=104269 RepID=UPI0038B65693
MKRFLLILFLFLQTLFVLSQEKEKLIIFKNSKDWQKEIIKFPIDWAPKLKFTGFEELLFTPNWSNPKNNEFWSLIIGWKVDTAHPLFLKDVTTNFKAYFDGLMKPNHWATDFPEPQVMFHKKNDGFTGAMTFFDGFHTGKVITVNIKGEQYFDKSLKKSILIFRLSPKDYKNPIWNQLNDIKLQNKNATIIQLDSSWGKEIFDFPIRFAKNINYKGIAEVRFPPKGWRNTEHPNFWSYVYAWYIDLDRKITKEELELNLQKYFDGLNNIEHNKNLNGYKASAKILKIKTIDDLTVYIGKIQTYDRFATNKGLTLNIIIENRYCKAKQRNIIFFKFSPKSFYHKTWQMLQKITLTKQLCY